MLYTARGMAICQYPKSEVELDSSTGKLKPIQEVLSLWTVVDAASMAALNLGATPKKTNPVLRTF